jgi:chemotaxis protein methyltransferase CheR
VAATLLAAWPEANKSDTRILATDVSQRALEKAQAGVYPVSALREIPERYRTHFHLRSTGTSRYFAADEPLKSMILFRPLNLFSSRFPFRGQFDVIFCRNVLIYFSPEDRRKLVERLVRLIAPGGHLFLGLSEALVEVPSGLESVGQSIYRRVGQA